MSNCLLCPGGLILMFVVWMLPKLARSGIIRFNPSGSAFRGSRRPFVIGRSAPTIMRRSTPTIMRRGSGSGRSGRGN